MKKIKLTQNKYTLVDEEDFERLSKHKWQHNGEYARRGNGLGKAIYMHREILGLLANRKPIVDHINRDPLDNRKSNLRTTTSSVNGLNTNKSWGVVKHPDARARPWWARICINKKRVSLGYYENELLAREAYVKAKEDWFRMPS